MSSKKWISSIRQVDKPSTSDVERQHMVCTIADNMPFHPQQGGNFKNCDVDIVGISVSLLIDEGAKVSIVSDNLYHKYFSSYPLNSAWSTLQAYDDSVIQMLGTITVPVTSKGIKLNKFTFCIGKGNSLMGINLFDKCGFKLLDLMGAHIHINADKDDT